MSLSHSEKRTRLTWALLLFFLALLSFIVFLQWKTKNENLVLSRAVSDVTRISIDRKDHPTIVLEKMDDEKIDGENDGRGKDGQWWITSPLHIPANNQRIIPLLTVYTNPDLGYPTDSVDLIATGLQDPEVIVSFNDYSVAIGNKAIDETKRHALHGDRVRFVPDWVLPLLQGGVSAVADLTVFGDELKDITLTSGLSLNEESLNKARELTAQQFVRWPRPEEPTILSEHEATITRAGESSQWTLFKTDRYVAMLPSNTHYAYVLPLSDAPWLTE